MRNFLGDRRVLFAAGFIALLLLAYFIVLLVILSGPVSTAGSRPTAVLVILPGPSATPTLNPYATETETALVVDPSGIKTGDYVQIKGTDGSGLNIRSGAGVNYTPNFVGLDAEVFLVQDGPVEADGYYWWLLVAPYDQNRSGWAASNFLTIVTNP
jgi:hypothetical protein